jgi:hypothetical protein
MREHPGGCSLTLQEEFVAIDFSQFKADSKKENEGVWIPVGPDSRVKIIRLSSRRFRDAQKEKMLPYENIQRLNVLKDEQQEILLGRVGWRNRNSGLGRFHGKRFCLSFQLRKRSTSLQRKPGFSDVHR